MSVLILQITIKQWDKSQRTDKHVEKRAKIPEEYAIAFPPAFHLFQDRCIVDQHCDDLLSDRLTYRLDGEGKIKFDRFQVCTNTKTIEYTGSPISQKAFRKIGSIDNNWIKCKYEWRYSVYKNDYYYWLYEEVSVNVISVMTLDKNIFLNSTPSTLFKG
tara:strand:- start:38 stop:514 length:477 start_codon:yes stop_codon:yes gene_type:complete